MSAEKSNHTGTGKEINWDRIINLSLGLIAIFIAFKAWRESVTNAQFVKLLSKTDTVLSTAENQLSLSDSQLITFNKQLILNEDLKKANDSANKYRFIAAIFELGSKLGAYAKTRDNAKKIAEREIEYNVEEIYSYVNAVMPIFEGQLNNPYLCENDTMLGVWINAYIHLNIVGNDDMPLLNNNGKPLLNDDGRKLLYKGRDSSPIDKISKIRIKRNFLVVWDAVNEAYLYCGKKVENESSRFIKN